jgi:hypothetical protein
VDEFDKRFEALVGPAAAKALADWTVAMGLDLAVSRLFVNGRSSATVVAAYERAPGAGVRKVVLKHDPVPEGEPGSGEFARQRQALVDAGDFRPHLANVLHDPIRVGDGTWITVQEYADVGIDEACVLTALLGAVPGVSLPGIRTTGTGVDVADVATVCAMVCASILASWVRVPEVERLAVSDFLRRHLADRVAPGKALSNLASRWPGRRIRLPGEAGDLPNPFALVFDPSSQVDVDVVAVVGKGHGDLHTENVIVSAAGRHFWLIDLARYRPDAPLTQDPVQLVLAVVNRALADLRPEDRETLLQVLAVPAMPGVERLPFWLAALIRGVRDACHAWIGPSHLGEEWRSASTLSTVACALIFAARPTTLAENRTWFLRLAGRATAAFLGSSVQDAEPAVGLTGLPDDGGLGQLCAAYDDLVAAGGSRAGAVVGALAARARHGVDIREELAGLAGEWRVRLDGDRGDGLAGLAGYPSAGEVFECPLAMAACSRRAERLPGGPQPFCRVGDREMARRSEAR